MTSPNSTSRSSDVSNRPSANRPTTGQRVPDVHGDPRRLDATFVPTDTDRPAEPPRDDENDERRIRLREWLGDDLDLRDVV